jgi:hypothetical protein
VGPWAATLGRVALQETRRRLRLNAMSFRGSVLWVIWSTIVGVSERQAAVRTLERSEKVRSAKGGSRRAPSPRPCFKLGP